MKNSKNVLIKITAQKISENEALKQHSDLITPDITKLKNATGKDKNKRNNILNILENLRSDFTGVYFHYKGVPLKLESESESEVSIAERTKLKKQRFDEIANKEKKIDPKLFREYFKYSSPSHMYKNLSETIDSEENEVQVNATKNNLANLMELIKDSSTSDANEIINVNNMQEIIKNILEFNKLNQSEKGFKILTPNQMLSKLPISLAQLNAGNNSEKLNNEIRQLLYSW